MTTYIETKKAEVRERLSLIERHMTSSQARQLYLEAYQFIDELFNDIESRVVPKKNEEPFIGHLCCTLHDQPSPIECNQRNQCRKEVLEAFQHLRTGGDITS